MDPTTRRTLQQAYHHIKAGDLAAARDLIKPVLAAERHTIDAWWLAAYAADNPHDKRLALVQVLRLNPHHGPARILLDRLNTEHPDTLDELARELPLPAVTRQPRPTDQPLIRNRWVWNIVAVLGCLGISFGSLSLVSAFFGLAWFDQAVENVGDVLGIDTSGERGNFGSIPGGPVGNPYDIPITKQQAAVLGSDTINLDVLEEDEAHVYVVSANQGEDIVVLLQFTVAGDARYVVKLRDNNGKTVADGVGEQDSGTVTLVYTAQRTGTYLLVIIGRPGGPHGDYFLGVDVLK